MATKQIQDGFFDVHNGLNSPMPDNVVLQARELLEQLVTARQLTEQRLADAGRFDPLKKVTGRSSLDNAIDRTQQLLRQLRDLSSETCCENVFAAPMIEIDSETCSGAIRNNNNSGAPHDAWRRKQTPALALVQ